MRISLYVCVRACVCVCVCWCVYHPHSSTSAETRVKSRAEVCSSPTGDRELIFHLPPSISNRSLTPKHQSTRLLPSSHQSFNSIQIKDSRVSSLCLRLSLSVPPPLFRLSHLFSLLSPSSLLKVAAPLHQRVKGIFLAEVKETFYFGMTFALS